MGYLRYCSAAQGPCAGVDWPSANARLLPTQYLAENIEDYVDVEEGEAWLSFRLTGNDYRWDAEVQDDWVDTTILSRFADLLTKQGRTRLFTYIDLGGQDCLIGCSTKAQRSALQERTGLKVEWLH